MARDRLRLALACRLGVESDMVVLLLTYDNPTERNSAWLSECGLHVDGHGYLVLHKLLHAITRVPGREIELRLAGLLRPTVEKLLADRLARTLE